MPRLKPCCRQVGRSSHMGCNDRISENSLLNQKKKKGIQLTHLHTYIISQVPLKSTPIACYLLFYWHITIMLSSLELRERHPNPFGAKSRDSPSSETYNPCRWDRDRRTIHVLSMQNWGTKRQRRELLENCSEISPWLKTGVWIYWNVLKMYVNFIYFCS